MEDLADIDETMLRWISEFTIVVESLNTGWENMGHQGSAEILSSNRNQS